ncbi:hypothetical protein QAD02_001681 [Eretmocerus hayati]|uniref:Uncharacterized protein n=1 Tax=Eretmocerus hayati TaxID=131215 RepID=A0ACC2NJL4_9HYME|nr:hypothetical protein QAD02_001681 [Eretmocerus hayati]
MPPKILHRRKYAVDSLLKEYRDKVDPNADWIRAGRRVHRLRRRFQAHLKSARRNLAEQGYDDKRLRHMYLCYCEEVPPVSDNSGIQKSIWSSGSEESIPERVAAFPECREDLNSQGVRFCYRACGHFDEQ